VSVPACTGVAEELVAYLDGEQPDGERQRVETHLGTCLTCRRELERVRRVRTLLGSLRSIEPSADFQAAFRRRLDAAPPRLARRRRAMVWGAPLLAAAAAVALVVYSFATRLPPGRQPAPATVAAAHRPAASGAASGETRVAAQHHEEQGASGRPDVAVANDDLDQYPPELIEHPELFLHYPVVRRLQRLQHFEEVRQHGDGEPLGSAPGRPLGASSVIG